MKIQLVSYKEKRKASTKLKLTAQIINESDADFILFPGSTLNTLDDLYDLEESITNTMSAVLVEVMTIPLGNINSDVWNCPFLIREGKIQNMHTFQFFSDAETIEHNDFLAEAFINELETRRQFSVNGYNCLLLECGENNILKNIQSQGNKPVIRIDNPDVANRFTDVLEHTDIILNIIHNPQPGNQNKLKERRIYFTQNGRFYFSTNNCVEVSETARSIMYACHDGKDIEPIDCQLEDKYMYRIYKI